MGNNNNIVLLNDGLYKYELPPIPKEQDIWFHDASKKNQYWKTPHSKNKWLNPDGTLKNVSKMQQKEKIEYIDYFRNIWENGLWVMVDGQPSYLSGLHAEHLLFNTYNSQSLLYFDDERFIFYFIDISEKSDECEGRVFIKPRRAKMTTIMCSVAQRKVLSDFSNYITLQSDTLDKAQKSYMQPIIDSYTRRPIWMREKFYAPNGKKPRKSLELISNVIEKEGEEWLGGKINIFPTLVKAIDGLEAVECIIDEFSKIEDISPYELYEVARKVVQNFRKKGKISCLSSSGDSKDAVKATMDWHKLIAKSNPQIVDEYGKTQSGLWKYFISAIHSQYVPKEFTDIYGKVDKEKAEEWIWNEIRKYPEGTKEYIYALYKLPLKEEHALLSSATTNLFPKIRIASRLTELEAMLPQDKPYVRGKLLEKNGKVYFEEDSEGLWLWSIHPYFSIEKNVDRRNRFRFVNGVFFPPVNPEGIIGYDPVSIDLRNVRSSNISQACLFIRKKFDYYHSPDDINYTADTVMAMYLGRTEDPKDVNKEAMKACRYTGFLCNHEKSVNHVFEDFDASNMLPFLMTWDGTYGMSPNQKNTRDGIVLLQSRYSTPKTPEDKDQIECYPFEDGLRSLDNFDQTNTTPFDPTMAEIYCEHGLNKLMPTNLTDSNRNNFINTVHEIMPPRNHMARK